MSFAQHLTHGYTHRSIDIDKKKTEDFIDRFFRFVFFLEVQRCTKLPDIETRLQQFKDEFTEILNSVTKDSAVADADYFFAQFPKVYNTL